MLNPGEVIEGKYRIVRELGKGGMGAVYEGENVRIHRKVAIKVLHASVAEKADVVQRFEREAQAAGRIGSEHIVEVLDLGSLPSGERFMVMEYLDGESLGDRIKRKKQLSPAELGPILIQMLEGLSAAHAAGIVHRDLKPDNVFILTQRGGQRDFVKILDFGVSKFSALDSDMSMTRTGAVMGTPYYMSPEQARGQKVDNRSDLYSVGVIMYQAITGRVPFRAETFNELVFKIALENAEPAEQVVGGLDPNFANLIHRAMAREADKRVQSAKEFQGLVQQWMASGPVGGFVPAPLGSQPGLTPAFQASHPGMATSQPSYPSQPSHPSFPGAVSGAGFGQSQPGLGQSGLQQSGLQQSGLQQSGNLSGTQPGLSMTAQPKSGSGALVAALLGGLLVLGGGGFAVWKFVLSKPGEARAAEAPKAPETSAPAGTGAAPASTGAPVAPPSASVAAPAPSVDETASAAVTGAPTGLSGPIAVVGPRPPVQPRQTAAPKETGSPKAPPQPTHKPTGARPVGSEL